MNFKSTHHVALTTQLFQRP